MPIINSIVGWFLKKRIHQINLFLKYPHDVQNEWFHSLIHNAEYTEWGKKYDYSSIKSVETFKERVPINDYNALKPYIDRLRKGEQSLLWPGETRYFAKSSGTTQNKSKFIPITEESLEDCHYKGGKDMLALYYDKFPETEILAGKTIGISGSADSNASTKSYVGDLSAILIHNLPLWAHYSKTPNLNVALMDKWEEKVNKIAEITVKEDVRVISGVPSWMLVVLNKVLELSGESNILNVWQNFELVVHGGVRFAPYQKQFENILGPNVRYMETYNASEGFFGIQNDLSSDDMLLMLDYGIYYEFMPMDQIHEEFPKTLGLDEVELNVNYALIISTNGGLWRYKIGDTIKFTSLNPFKIKVSGRTKSFINLVGEELIVDNSDNAIEETCRKTGAIIKEYTAGPIYYDSDDDVGHQWLIEFEKKPSDIDKFAKILDSELQKLNSDYEAKRYKNMVLNPLKIVLLPKGTFHKWLKAKNKLGGQNKVPRLSNDRKLINEITALI